MAARGKFFRSYYLPVLSAEQNESQSEDIDEIDAGREQTRARVGSWNEMEKKFHSSVAMFVELSGRPNG